MTGDLLPKEALCCHLCDHLLGLPGPVCSQKLLSYVLLFYVLIFGCAGSWLPRGLFSAVDGRGPSLVRGTGFSLRRLLLLPGTDSRGDA